MNIKIEKLTAPVPGFEEILDWLAEIFGEGEKKLEYPQLSGAETSFNDDVIFKATDGGKILGSVHVTIPRADPTIAGVSAMFTTPEARGRGVGRIIFSEAIAYLDSIGVKTAFLGTGAPIAEKLYASLGFRYLYGSGVMFRSTEGAPVDFYKRRFSSAPSRITVAEGDCEIGRAHV